MRATLTWACRLLWVTGACAASALAAPASAEDRSNLVAASRLTGPTAPEPGDSSASPVARVHISIGPQTVQPGETRYAARTTVAGTAQIVEFAASPPTPSAGRRGTWRPGSLPVSAARLTSGFGMRTHPISGQPRAHAGIDLAAPYGSSIVATGDGVVGAAHWAGGYGLMVTISHGDGVQTRYGHLSRLNVTAGQDVRAGDVIGFVGSTGESTGPHVHYEVRIGGAAIDPLQR